MGWEDGTDSDVKALGEINWKNIARNRQFWWKLLLRQVMALKRAVSPIKMIPPLPRTSSWCGV
jgi:hypothetical protein